jgi:hypothetical protein
MCAQTPKNPNFEDLRLGHAPGLFYFTGKFVFHITNKARGVRRTPARARKESPAGKSGAGALAAASPSELELVRDEAQPSQVSVWNRAGAALAKSRGAALAKSRVNRDDLSPDVLRFAQALALPTQSTCSEPIGNLLAAIAATIQAHVELPAEYAHLLAYYVVGTWFPEYAVVAPVVVITGSAIGVQPLLRILRSMCRRGLLVADLTPSALSRATMLMPTLIIAHSNLNDRLVRLVLASSIPGYLVLGSGEPRQIFCAKVIFANGEEVPDELGSSAVRVTIPPPTRPTRLTGATLKKIEIEFQNRLFAYRLAAKEKVAVSDFDVPSFGFEMRPLAQTLGSCIVDNPELQSRLADLLKAQDAENRATHAADIRCVVIEAVLFHKREGIKHKFLVAEIAETVNVLLHHRGETGRLKERAVGEHLKKLGFRKKREGPGVYLIFDAGNADLVERLAQQYDVLSTQVDSGHWMNSVRHTLESSE